MREIKWHGKDFVVQDISDNFKIAIPNEFIAQFEKSKNLNFIEIFSPYIDRISKLPIYKTSPVFSLFVLQKGKEFRTLTNCYFDHGMCGSYPSLDPNYPLSLVVDNEWFFKGFTAKPSIERDIGMLHELSHIVHSSYFMKLGMIMEGVAEVIPFYIMNLEHDKHMDTIFALRDENIPTLDYLNKNGMFSLPEDQDTRTQYRKSYLSAYLWMRGYLKRVEQIYQNCKMDALKRTLNEFERINDLFPSKKALNVAKFINSDEKTLYHSLTLQHEAIQDIRSTRACLQQARIDKKSRFS